VLAKVM